MKLATENSYKLKPYKPKDKSPTKLYLWDTLCTFLISDINTKLDNHVVITFFLIIFGY